MQNTYPTHTPPISRTCPAHVPHSARCKKWENARLAIRSEITTIPLPCYHAACAEYHFFQRAVCGQCVGTVRGLGGDCAGCGHLCNMDDPWLRNWCTKRPVIRYYYDIKTPILNFCTRNRQHIKISLAAHNIMNTLCTTYILQ